MAHSPGRSRRRPTAGRGGRRAGSGCRGAPSAARRAPRTGNRPWPGTPQAPAVAARSMSARLACAVRMRTFRSGWSAHELGRRADAVPVREVHVHQHHVRVQPLDGGECLARVLCVADALHVATPRPGPGPGAPRRSGGRRRRAPWSVPRERSAARRQRAVGRPRSACSSSSGFPPGLDPRSPALMTSRPRHYGTVATCGHREHHSSCKCGPITVAGIGSAVHSPFGLTQPGLGPRRSNDLDGRHRSPQWRARVQRHTSWPVRKCPLVVARTGQRQADSGLVAFNRALR